MATLFSVLMAANFRTGFGDDKKSWSTKVSCIRFHRSVPHSPATGRNRSAVLTFRISQIALAASILTMSDLCRNKLSRYSCICF